MSTLTLVRHAQASFFAENYDQLSLLGETQARLLGEALVQWGEEFDEVFVGPAVRHKHTAKLVGDAYRAAGRRWPQPVVLNGLDEHAADLLLQKFAEEPHTCPAELRELAAQYRAAKEPAAIQKSFQKLFEATVHCWIDQKVDLEAVGTWDAYRDRVYAAMRQMTTDRSAGAKILAVGSTGSITLALQFALQTSDRTSLQLGWRLRNCALSRFIFSGERITLDTFNNLAHFDDPNLVTFR